MALSAQPIADVELGVTLSESDLANPPLAMSDDPQFQQVANIRQQYGFDGRGQTVAIIDSGIAWDHAALGDGFGVGHKVVGGWDFAENDSNPYDDGPFGYHGTHVAGIVGNTDPTRYGVASGVDLVALRVFNDNGVSDFNWIEQALRWVHQHKDDYANPITTVNLSVGTRTNLVSLPALASLSDEFAQLESDGIFISVAAGNSFQAYLTPGLTYPAISPNVVAVSSHDASGLLSDFSQRAEQVLVAPGRSIISTVPDHVFAGAQADGFLTGTGTSMAAPYVAGASTLLRQAREFMGNVSTTQDDLYALFRQSADRFFDSATSQYYHRINLQAAIDAVIGDDHSNTGTNATKLGSLTDLLKFNGTIGQTTDIDQFVFTPSANGTVTLTVDATHELRPVLTIDGITQQIIGEQINFAVRAGQTYQIALSTADSIGHFQASLRLDRAFEPMALGSITQRVVENQSVRGEQWFSLSASNTGLLTIEALQPAGVTKLELYSDRMQLLRSATNWGANLRLDADATSEEVYFVRVVGNTSQLELRVTNLVSISNGLMHVRGTDQSDRMALSVGSDAVVHLNDVAYRFSATDVRRIEIDGGAGQDEIQIYGSEGDDRFRIDVGSMWLANSQVSASAIGFESVFCNGRGGLDVGIMTDSQGDDLLIDSDGRSKLSGVGYDHTLVDFERTRAISRAGRDAAHLNDTAGIDRFIGQVHSSSLRSIGRSVIVDQFASVVVRADRGGQDSAELYDTSGDDRFNLRAGFAGMNAAIQVYGFESLRAVSRSGSDAAFVTGSAAADHLLVAGGVTSFLCQGSQTELVGFDSIFVDGGGGQDTAEINGFADFDSLWGRGSNFTATQTASRLSAINFENLWASALAGSQPNSELIAVDYLYRLFGDWDAR